MSPPPPQWINNLTKDRVYKFVRGRYTDINLSSVLITHRINNAKHVKLQVLVHSSAIAAFLDRASTGGLKMAHVCRSDDANVQARSPCHLGPVHVHKGPAQIHTRLGGPRAEPGCVAPPVGLHDAARRRSPSCVSSVSLSFLGFHPSPPLASHPLQKSAKPSFSRSERDNERLQRGDPVGMPAAIVSGKGREETGAAVYEQGQGAG
ncbi:hypothetical protein C0993_010060, partial [Termitomyces sp. T159_Od127]